MARRLRRDEIDRHFAGQLARSATSAVAHYAEAVEAESRLDFIHKLKVGLKELRECEVWLAMLNRLTPSDASRALARECHELCAIFVASINTARTNAGVPARRTKATGKAQS